MHMPSVKTISLTVFKICQPHSEISGIRWQVQRPGPSYTVYKAPPPFSTPYTTEQASNHSNKKNNMEKLHLALFGGLEIGALDSSKLHNKQ